MSTPLADPVRELLRATGLGDQIAFAELYRLTSGKLDAIANRMLRRTDTASEALRSNLSFPVARGIRLLGENRAHPPNETATMAVRPAPVRQFGNNTLSITWITPLL